MAVATSSDKSAANMAITHYVFNPDDTNAADVAWVDMRDFDKIIVSFTRVIGTGNLDTFTLIANTAADGGGSDAEVKAHAVASEPNLAGDYIFLEATADEIASVGTAYRYVSVKAEFATGTDEGVVTYIRSGARFARDGLTSDNIQ